MADNNRPKGREKNVTGDSSDFNRRGEGLGTGPVGNKEGYSGRPTSGDSSRGGSGSSSGRASGSSSGSSLGILSLFKNKRSLIIVGIIIILLIIIFKDKLPFGLGGLSSLGDGSSVLSSFTSSNEISGWSAADNTGKLDTSVAKGARDRYTTLKGDGKDTVTILVYMCGTDLESKSGMATNDLNEMKAASLSDKVNLLIYTGGCKTWKTSSISNSVNQIWQIKGGKLTCLEKDMGSKAMTKPSTLTEFIKYGKDKFPADRTCLIFWDHGGGSLSGYGYDEKNTSSGSMTLKGINTALSDGGVKFDFIGFDACLMATAENAIMLTQYADYMIASEETEPGVGWYYTDWLNSLSKNTSISTLELGKQICDTFTDYCAKHLKSAKTTLSVVDLAELETTIPDSLKSFATSTTQLINDDNYKQVSTARSDAREFASSSKIDQVDLVDFASKLGTKEGKELANTILSAVKYNSASPSMANSYGLSIYFPYRKTSGVNNAADQYDAIGVDGEYSECIKAFAGLELAGQASTGGSTSAISSLLGTLGNISTSSTTSSVSGISSLLSGIIGGSQSVSVTDVAPDLLGSLLSNINIGKAATFIEKNHLDATDFIFKNYKGTNYIDLSDEKWSLVENIELNVFVDDGKGYVDLGLDNCFDIQNGMLVGEYDGTWVAINGQLVAFYHESTVETSNTYTITGRIPVLYNAQRAELVAVYTDKNPKGEITGVRYVYGNETDTVAKSLTDVQDGDKIDFIFDYYSYNGEYQDTYMYGKQLTVNGELTLSDVRVNQNTSATYRITDIYGQHFWTSVMD